MIFKIKLITVAMMVVWLAACVSIPDAPTFPEHYSTVRFINGATDVASVAIQVDGVSQGTMNSGAILAYRTVLAGSRLFRVTGDAAGQLGQVATDNRNTVFISNGASTTAHLITVVSNGSNNPAPSDTAGVWFANLTTDSTYIIYRLTAGVDTSYISGDSTGSRIGPDGKATGYFEVHTSPSVNDFVFVHPDSAITATNAVRITMPTMAVGVQRIVYIYGTYSTAQVAQALDN